MSAKNITTIEVTRRQGETGGSLARRFSRKAQQARLVKIARKKKFRERPLSEKKKKNSTLRRITRRKQASFLRKIGKMKKKK